MTLFDQNATSPLRDGKKNTARMSGVFGTLIENAKPISVGVEPMRQH